MQRWWPSIAFAMSACGGDAMESQTIVETTTVRFEYDAPTAIRPEVENTACANIIGGTHIHLSWRNYSLVRLFPVNEHLWVQTFHDVPFGSHKIRVSDPNECVNNSTGAVTSTVVRANGVLLTHEVLTPGDGPEPGFAFGVGSDGVVVP